MVPTMLARMINSRRDSRRAARVEATRSAKISLGGEWYAVLVRNISPTGARIETGIELLPKQEVVFTMTRLGERKGYVIWCDGSAAGIQFKLPIELQQFARADLGGPAVPVAMPTLLDRLKQLISA